MIKYGGIGGVCAATDTAIFSAAVFMTSISPLIINIFTYTLGTIMSFFLNSKYNFRTKSRPFRQLFLFFVASFIGLTLSSLIIAVVKNLNVNIIAAKILSLFIIFFVQFSFNNYITFRK